jgi:Na+/proline symporter
MKEWLNTDVIFKVASIEVIAGALISLVASLMYFMGDKNIWGLNCFGLGIFIAGFIPAIVIDMRRRNDKEE